MLRYTYIATLCCSTLVYIIFIYHITYIETFSTRVCRRKNHIEDHSTTDVDTPNVLRYSTDH